MPSDAAIDGVTEGTERALRAVRGRVDAFHAAVAEAEREVADEVVRRSGEEDVRGEQALIELGPFAVGRIDPDRFARLLGIAEAPLTPEAVDVLSRADSILREFVAEPSEHVVDVEAGGDVRDVVRDALAGFGRVFGAARAVELARAGIFDEPEHGHLLGPLPFRRWHRAERRLAPPLVVRLRGDDCLAAGLGEFLDGNVAVVLVAEGPTTPAPLSRLVTPGTFVLQTSDPAELECLADTEHPAIALLFDEERPEQACFVHDPDGGSGPWERLTVHRMPGEAAVGRGRRVPMWVEELDHLRQLAEAPHTAATPPDSTTVPADSGTTTRNPADRLAAWLLARTHVGEAEAAQ